MYTIYIYTICMYIICMYNSDIYIYHFNIIYLYIALSLTKIIELYSKTNDF